MELTKPAAHVEGSAFRIANVSRVQNPKAHACLSMTATMMEQCNEDRPEGLRYTEPTIVHRIYHGTDIDTAYKIAYNGFETPAKYGICGSIYGQFSLYHTGPGIFFRHHVIVSRGAVGRIIETPWDACMPAADADIGGSESSRTATIYTFFNGFELEPLYLLEIEFD